MRDRMNESNVKKRHSIVVTMIRIGVIPILLLGIGLTVYSQYSVREGMDYEVERSLSGIAHNLLSTYNALDGGEFNMDGDTLKKGETTLTSDYRIIDDIKTDTGTDVTIYYGSKRRMTTIVDKNGDRLTDTEAPEGVVDYVFGQNEEYFSTDINVEECLITDTTFR